MTQDEIRKKIIKDKFDELELVIINNENYSASHEFSALVSDNEYGMYVDDTFNGFNINPYYFMFNYIGLGPTEDVRTLREYVNYIASLAQDKFKFKINLLSKYENPRRLIDYQKDVVDNITEYIFNNRRR